MAERLGGSRRLRGGSEKPILHPLSLAANNESPREIPFVSAVILAKHALTARFSGLPSTKGRGPRRRLKSASVPDGRSENQGQGRSRADYCRQSKKIAIDRDPSTTRRNYLGRDATCFSLS